MSSTLHLSRAFVEFGPFTADEMRAFLERGILKSTDYIRVGSSETWLHVDEWAATGSKPAVQPVAEAKPAAAKKAPAKKAAPKADAPAKKAAKK
jgi:hypothetical protein